VVQQQVRGQARRQPAPTDPPRIVPWDAARLIRRPFTVGRGGACVCSVVWHSLEGSADGAISWWESQGGASAHFIITRAGRILLTVPLEHTAWHAGTDGTPGSGVYGRTPFWRTHNVNQHSVGVELEGFAATGFTHEQAASARRLADWLTAQYPIPRAHTRDQYAGHHRHSEISAQRSDPGPFFQWEWVL
jgi:N-acetyl-anhydromuramyl-L-alanine amidase AmpD